MRASPETRQPPALARLDSLLALNPDFHYWVLSYGTNDVTSDPSGAGADVFALRMGAMAARIQSAGHVPLLVHIPYSRDPNRQAIPQYNAALDRLAAQKHLLLGPDLYAYFAAHPDLLSADGVHPTDAGTSPSTVSGPTGAGGMRYEVKGTRYEV